MRDDAEVGAFGVGAHDLQPTVFYVATLRLLLDLVLQGWAAGADDGIYIPPLLLTAGGEDPSESKLELRDSFKFALVDQLLFDSVIAFIARMEKPGVTALFAFGPELADRLAGIGEDGNVSAAIRPALQLVSVDQRDPDSGLKLQDIWRYARPRGGVSRCRTAAP